MCENRRLPSTQKLRQKQDFINSNKNSTAVSSIIPCITCDGMCDLIIQKLHHTHTTPLLIQYSSVVTFPFKLYCALRRSTRSHVIRIDRGWTQMAIHTHPSTCHADLWTYSSLSQA
uniref:Uncharacterized protein n=2 Tax=Anguilla anguilla TaxID=7936 RepID=A0A0E9P6F2_ANGAN